MVSGNLLVTGSTTQSVGITTGDTYISGNLTVRYSGNILGPLTGSSNLSLRQAITTSGTANPAALFTGAAHGALTASAESIDVNVNLARTVQFSTGGITTQRAFLIQAPTYGFIGASTITTATTLEISGAPVAGTNATITNAYALNVGGATTQVTATSLQYSAVNLPAHTVTLTGTTQVTSSPAAAGIKVGQITLSDSSAVTVDNAASIYVSAAPVGGGGGPVTLTNAYSLWLDAGAARFDDHLLWGAGVAVTAGNYSIGRDADGTNQLHLNVPTGASFEFSINDAAELTLNATNLSPGANDGLALGVSGTAFADLFLATGGTINFGASNILMTHAAGFLGVAASAVTPLGLFHVAHADAGSPAVDDTDCLIVTGATSTTERLHLKMDTTNNLGRIWASVGTNATPILIGGSSFAGNPVVSIGTAGSALLSVYRNGQSSGASAIVDFTVRMGTYTWSGNLAAQQNWSLFGQPVCAGSGSLRTLDIVTTVSLEHPTISGTLCAFTEVSALKMLTTDYSLTSAAAHNQSDILFDTVTLTYTGTTQITSAEGSNSINVRLKTITDSSALTLDNAGVMLITGVPSVGGSVTITNAYGIKVGGATTHVTASGFNYKLISIPAHTLTLTGTTQVTSTPAAAGVSVAQITITDASAATIDSAASVYIANAPVAGGSVTLTNTYSLWVDAGAARFDGRVLQTQGADVASANNLTLGADGNVFEITGTTQINLIANTNWQNGAMVTLIFNESVTVAHGQATSGSNITILLAAAGNFSATANDTLTLLLCETTANGQAWREVARTVI